MQLQCKGVVQGNIVILEEGGSLPDGTHVLVRVEPRVPSEEEDIFEKVLEERRALTTRMSRFGQKLAKRNVALGDLVLEGREELNDRA
jgi:hypothetical protein